MRPDLDHYMMELAKVAATRTTCIKRGVGCVLTDDTGFNTWIGYNGVASGMPHCNEEAPGLDNWQQGTRLPVHLPHACKGHSLPSGQDSCEAVHAEINALLKCPDVKHISTAYVTLSPCKPCLKALINTGCTRIVFLQEHADPWPREQWLKLGRHWDKLS